jgi:molybdopterin biosynthesis enzyme
MFAEDIMVTELETLQRIVRLTPLDDVLARIDALVKPVAARSAANLAAALGRTLADDIVIAEPIPKTALALRDGWAVQFDLTTDAGPYAPAPVPAAVRIVTGEPMPSGADAVAAVDAVVVRDGEAQALAPVVPGEGVLPAGADVADGATLIPAGRRLCQVQIALLAIVGMRSVTIREPRLRVARARAQPDRMIDAAIESIAHAIRRAGALAVTGDGNEALAGALTQADADAVVVVGGTGCGRNDAAVATLASLGTVEAHGIGLSPAETAAFGTVGGRPVLALPGRLDAALAAWHMLGQAMLARLAASSEPICLHAAKLTRKISSAAGLAQLVAVRCEGSLATPIASGYVPIAALAQANGWIFITPGSEGYQAHSEVMVRPWP